MKARWAFASRPFTFQVAGSYKMVTYETARERVRATTHSKVLAFDLRTGEAVGQADLPRFASEFWIDKSEKP